MSAQDTKRLVRSFYTSPSVGEPGYLPYCPGPGMHRMVRGADAFECKMCNVKTRRVNGEDMFDRTAPKATAA